MTHIKTKLLLTVSTVLSFTSTAFAGGTAAGTIVSNTFTLNYEVNNIAQPTITPPTSTDFVVDQKIDLTVAAQTSNVSVTPGATNTQLVYGVTNEGNETQNFRLTIPTGATGSNDFNPGTGVITYYVDDGDGVFQDDGTDGSAITYNGTHLNSPLAPDAKVWVVVTHPVIPNTATDGQVKAVALVARALNTDATPSVLTADSDGNDDQVREIAFADAAGTDDAAADAQHSARATYTIGSARLNAEKLATVFSQDGTGCETIPGTPASGNQYSVPGACIQYTITVNNTGSSNASDIALSDTLPDTIKYVAATHTGFTGVTLAVPAAACTASCVVSISDASLAAGATGVLTIRTTLK